MSEEGLGWVGVGIGWDFKQETHVYNKSPPHPCLSSIALSSSFRCFVKISANINFNCISEPLMSNYDSADQNFVNQNSAGGQQKIENTTLMNQ